MTLFTIGYERRSFEDFYDLLQARDVDFIYDVRRSAFSRRPEFSPPVIPNVLQDWAHIRRLARKRHHHIGYHHFPDLGPSQELRRRLNRDAADGMDIVAYLEEYKAETLKMSVESQIIDVTTTMVELGIGGPCLFCYERDHKVCHRSVLADRMIELSGFLNAVVHL